MPDVNGASSRCSRRTGRCRPRRSLVGKKLAQRVAQPGDARRAVVALTDAGRALYDELFPQVVAINLEVLGALEAPLVAALDEALARLTVHAAEVNRAHVLDVQADRRHGGSRRHWRE